MKTVPDPVNPRDDSNAMEPVVIPAVNPESFWSWLVFPVKVAAFARFKKPGMMNLLSPTVSASDVVPSVETAPMYHVFPRPTIMRVAAVLPLMGADVSWNQTCLLPAGLTPRIKFIPLVPPKVMLPISTMPEVEIVPTLILYETPLAIYPVPVDDRKPASFRSWLVLHVNVAALARISFPETLTLPVTVCAVLAIVTTLTLYGTLFAIYPVHIDVKYPASFWS